MKANPFFELYVGDRISSREYVTLFSPLLVPHTEALFLPGNIVVTGIQGCGKSMLLSLLKPRVRLEFEEAEAEFPVKPELRKFICGSVNLAHSAAIDFGYRSHIDADVLETEMLFGDFLNYLLVASILDSLRTYAGASPAIQAEVGLGFDQGELDSVAHELSTLDVWEGWIGECSSMEQLSGRLSDRIRAYRRFLHRKDKELSPKIFDTATAIGRPLNDVARCLKQLGAIDEDTNVFVDIDQYEELGNISSRDTPGKDVDYRAVINKALSSRSPEVSYRIGTRGHSWRRHGKIHGTNGNLELTRHYKYIDLDSILRKDEVDSTRARSVFKELASDVFARRLNFARYSVADAAPLAVLQKIYGATISPKDKVNKHFGLRNPEQYVRVSEEWSDETKRVLRDLATRDLFSAKLGEVWVRQKGDVESLSVRDGKLPWERNSNVWWRKERAQILALQVASQSRQKSVWGGADEIVELAGGSILAFLGINQFIWSAWLQRNGDPSATEGDLPHIGLSVQSIGILKASDAWMEMVPEQTGKSAERLRFIKRAASVLREKLMSDKALSYPGANGFSLLESDLVEHRQIAEFLEELSDYGNMLMLSHTSKERGKPARKKFYFNPIFCPTLGIPYIRTKEPLYSQIGDVAAWMYESGIDVKLGRPSQSPQASLFDEQ